MAHTPTDRSAGLEYWLRHFGMPEENIEKCVTQIAQGYGACRYLEGVQIGAEAVNELAEQEHPSLPSNLDEAAEEYSTNLDYYHYIGDEPAVAFKAGAEWMAGQGETQEHFVIGSIAGSPCGPAVVCYTDEFDLGDEVIVQVRKK